MISVLLIFLLFAVLQVAVLFYARNIVSASAADGARYAAGSGAEAGDGGTRASSEIRSALSASIADGVPCTGSVGTDAATGLRTTVVTCEGKLRSMFLPIGAFVHVKVTARALSEPPS